MTTSPSRAATGRGRTAARRGVAVVALAVVLAGCGGPAAPLADSPVDGASVDAPAGAGGGSPTPAAESPTPAGESPTPTTESPTARPAGRTPGDVTPMVEPPDEPPEPRKHPSLSSALAGLPEADDRAAYAERHGLALRNGSVLVVVELRAGRDLPAGFDVTVEVRAGDDVQARVAVGDLVALAEHENVSFVRPPHRPVEHGGTESP